MTYDAFYPIHAYVEFESQGVRQTAHPILVIPVQLGNPPTPELPPDMKPPPSTPTSLSALPAPVFPPQGTSRSLGTVDRYQVRVWPGQRGLLDATIEFQDGPRQLFFRGFQARVLGGSLESPDSVNKLIEAREESAGDRYRIHHRFQNWAGPFDLVTDTWIEKRCVAHALHD